MISRDEKNTIFQQTGGIKYWIQELPHRCLVFLALAGVRQVTAEYDEIDST
jgi:hypothetical protein